MVEIEVFYFNKNGEWSLTENLCIPCGLYIHDTRTWIRENRPFKKELILIITNDTSLYYVGYPMMDSIKEEQK